MFCTQCGEVAADNAKFCGHCGALLEVTAQAAQTISAVISDAPESSIEVSVEKHTEAYFFSTSTFKLALMSICTLGLYEVYWFYKNWGLIKERTGQNIMPFWRAWFAPLWAYSCFKIIKNSANENSVPDPLSIGLLAITYFIFQGLWRLPDPYWIVAFLSFLFLIPANNVALNINKKLISEFANNEKISGWNWVGIVLGGLLFLLMLLGIFLPDV